MALMAMGKYTPLYETVIQHLPGFDLFRIPARWLMGVNLALAVLAGFGAQTVFHRGVSKRALAILATCLMVLAGIGLIWFLTVDAQSKLTQALLDKGFTLDPIYFNRQWPSGLVWLSNPAMLLAVNIAITVILFALYAWQRISSRVFG